MPDFSRAIYQANFVDDREISDPVVIGEILTSMGLEPRAILEAAVSTRNKERLRSQTERAWDMGIFGAPTFIVDGEVFWGNDRLEEALEWCRRRE